MTVKNLLKAVQSTCYGSQGPLLLAVSWDVWQHLKRAYLAEKWVDEKKPKIVSDAKFLIFYGIGMVYCKDLRKGRLRIWDYKLRCREFDV